jgi:hypothetical protein
MAVTTSQIVPQSPRERSSVTVHAALSGRRGIVGWPERRGSCALRETAGPASGTEFFAINVSLLGSGGSPTVSDCACRAPGPSTAELNFGSTKAYRRGGRSDPATRKGYPPLLGLGAGRTAFYSRATGASSLTPCELPAWCFVARPAVLDQAHRGEDAAVESPAHRGPLLVDGATPLS